MTGEFTPEPVTTHHQFELSHPDDAAHERVLEQTRRNRWLLTHGGMDGYRPVREFPCRGVLSVVDRNEHHETVACDVCRWETSVRTRGREPATTRTEW